MLVFFMLLTKKLIKKFQSVSPAGKSSGKLILLFLELPALPQNVDPEIERALVLKVKDVLNRESKGEDTSYSRIEIEELVNSIYSLTTEQIEEVEARQ